MVNFDITDEQRAIRETVRSFVDAELMPQEADFVRAGGAATFGHAEIRALQARARRDGLWGVSTPEEYGGSALDAVTQSLIATELGRTFLPFRFGGEADNILYYADDQQTKEYLLPTIEGERTSCFAITEPGAGSDAAAIRTTARQDGSDWVIDGEKTFITGGNDADFAIVIAVTDPEKRSRGGFTAFLVDRSMGWTSSPISTMGLARPATLSFAGVRVPDSNVLGEIGDGFRLAMEWIGRGRFLIPSQAIGAGERLPSMAIGYATDRTTFGRPIADNQAIGWMVADSEVELEAARWLVLKAAWTVDQGRDSRHDCAIAKLSGTTMANRVVDRVMQIHGGMGYTREMPIEQFYRDMRLWRIFEGTDEMQRLIISRDLLRGYTRVGGHLAAR
jgi:acyl-CoA dehydrogenase